MKEISMIIMTLFLLVGMTGSVNAQDKIAPLPFPTPYADVQNFFLPIPANNFPQYYLDTSRIIKYVNSRLLDCWVKKVMTEQDRTIEIQQKKQQKPSIEDKEKAKLNKNLSKQDKKKAELDKITFYQLIHQQFDPINFKYKVLEIYSYNANSQLLSSTTNQFSWVTIPVDSIEDKTLTSINVYIQNGVDKVVFK